MLEHASWSASDQNTTSSPLTPTHVQLTSPGTDSNDTEEIEIVMGRDASDPPPAVVEVDHTDDELDEEELEVDNDKGTKLDPNYTARLTPGNINRRTTRATRDPNIPHCSLLIQAFKYCVSQTAANSAPLQEPSIDTTSLDSLLHEIGTQQTNY